MIRQLLQGALLCLSLAATAAASELVILVQPKDASPQLKEAFNRLRGELHLHGFTVEVVTAEEDVDAEVLSRRADHQKAVASVTFASHADGDGVDRVDVWISDRVTGKTTSQTIVPRSKQEAPTVLAVRALELLRASLREVETEESEVVVVGAHPERAAEAVAEIRTPPPPRSSLLFEAGMSGTWSLPDGQDAYGPELAVGYVHGAFGARLFGAGPMQTGLARGEIGSVRYQTLELGVEPLLFPIRSPRWTLGFFPTVGATHLEVEGEIGAPYAGARDTSWLFTLGGGAEGAVRVTRTVEVYLRGRGFWLLPRPIVYLGDDQIQLMSPGFSLGLGVRLSPG